MDNDFFLERQKAIERMRETAKRSKDFGVPAPHFARQRNEARNERKRQPDDRCPPKDNRDFKKDNFLGDILKGFNIPFLSDNNTGDTGVLLALMLLLLGDGGDKLLLYALIYILL